VEKKIRIKLVKSLIGVRGRIRDNVKALGLGKVNSSVEHTPSPDILGKISKALGLLKIEEVK